MSEKRFVYYEHKGADYILDTPNTELDFIEMLGDALETEEIVNKLNEQQDIINNQEQKIQILQQEINDTQAILEMLTEKLKGWNDE